MAEQEEDRSRSRWEPASPGSVASPGSSDLLASSAARGGTVEGAASFINHTDVELWDPLFKDSPNLGKCLPRM